MSPSSLVEKQEVSQLTEGVIGLARGKVPGMRGELVYRGRHVTATFEMNREEIARCAVGPDLRDACNQVVVRRALPYALSISPVSDRDHPHYVGQFAVVDVLTGLPPEKIGKIPMLRVATRLYNLAVHAAIVEVGDGHGQQGHYVLTRTLNHLHATGR